MRTDVTWALAAIRNLNRLELVTETMRAAPEAVAVAACGWLSGDQLPGGAGAARQGLPAAARPARAGRPTTSTVKQVRAELAQVRSGPDGPTRPRAGQDALTWWYALTEAG